MKQLEAALPPKPNERLPERFASSELFDPTFYKNTQGDVYAAYQKTTTFKEQGDPGWEDFAKTHWLTFGVREGRQASPTSSSTWALLNYAPNLNDENADASLLPVLATPEGAIGAYLDLPAATRATVKTGAISPETADLPFGAHGLKLDVYAPPGNRQDANGQWTKRVPVVISLPGGGFADCEKTHPAVTNQANRFAEQGVAVVVPEYRVTSFGKDNNITQGLGSHRPGDGPVQWPEPLNDAYDAYDALKYVKDNADRYGWDLDNVTIMSGSAGAVLALDVAFGKSSPLKIKNVVAEVFGSDFSAKVGDSLAPLLPPLFPSATPDKQSAIADEPPHQTQCARGRPFRAQATPGPEVLHVLRQG